MKLANLIKILLLHLFYLSYGTSYYYYNQFMDQNQNISSFRNFENSKQASFEYSIPNTSLRLKINVTIQLIDQSFPEPNPPLLKTTTTTQSPWESFRPTFPDQRTESHNAKRSAYTILEAIDSFKKDLVEKEKRIGGILESPGVFHRHFNLVYDNCEIRVKCSYYSNYEKRTLNIYCFEFSENNREALHERASYVINPTIIHVDRYYQTLHMKVQ